MTAAAAAPLGEPKTVGDLMTRYPLALMPDERLSVARAIMVSCRLRHLPVAHGGQLVGILSARDLAGIASPEKADARSVMHSPVDTVESTTSIATAVERLLARRVSSLPVVDGSSLVGIVTTTDFLRLACASLGSQPVSRLMTPAPLVTVEPTQPLSVARDLMKADHIRHLPVVANHHLVGFLSDLDLLAAENNQLVAEALPRRLASVSPEARAVEAGRILVRERLDALPVVRGGKLVGVLSAFDYLHHLLS